MKKAKGIAVISGETTGIRSEGEWTALNKAGAVAAFATGSSPPSLSWALAKLATRYATAVGPAREGG